MDTWVTLCVLLLLPVWIRTWKHFGRLRIDPSEPSQFAGAYRGRKVFTFTGRASDIGKVHDSIVEGGVSSSRDADGVASVLGRIRTRVVVHDQFVLTSGEGVAQTYQVQGFDAAIGVGHVCSIAWTIRKRGNTGPYFLVYDHTTRQAFFNDGAIRKVIFPYHPYYVAALFLLILPIPVLVIIGVSAELQLRNFKRGGVRPLIETLDASTSNHAPQRDLKAADLETLAALVREGLLTQDEWSRAKRLFLEKAADDRSLALEHLRQLHGLYRGGALSESEFNTKKWEILARESSVRG